MTERPIEGEQLNLFRHPRAGHAFDMQSEQYAYALDYPQRMRVSGLDPDVAVASARLTAEREAKRRGGLMFCGEYRERGSRGDMIVQMYKPRTWWRVVWYGVRRPRRQKRRGSGW
jgi:hypothetical protein